MCHDVAAGGGAQIGAFSVMVNFREQVAHSTALPAGNIAFNAPFDIDVFVTSTISDNEGNIRVVVVLADGNGTAWDGTISRE
jgi:hypothetical protein